jgi:hypothetical protein
MSSNSPLDPGDRVPPDWALGQAMHDLDDDDDVVGRDERAWQLVQDLEAERQDEDEDPDQGGEA